MRKNGFLQAVVALAVLLTPIILGLMALGWILKALPRNGPVAVIGGFMALGGFFVAALTALFLVIDGRRPDGSFIGLGESWRTASGIAKGVLGFFLFSLALGALMVATSYAQ